MNRWLSFLLIIIMGVGSLAGCQQPAPASLPTLKIAILPIVDALPLYVAEENGYFKDAGVQVEFIPAASAADRDQLISAGQADGMINDPVAVALLNRETTTVQVVRISRSTAPGYPMYHILVPGVSPVQTPSQLAGVPIGVSEYSVINYVTDQLLLQAGLTSDQIAVIAIPKIPDRLSLLTAGELGAATLPEPFGTLALAQGARSVLDDASTPGLGDSVLSFRLETINAQSAAIQSFVAAVDKAVVEVNANPETYRPLLTKYQLVPEAFAATYPIPPFPGPAVPTQAQFDSVNSWLILKGKLTAPLVYGDSINSTFLP